MIICEFAFVVLIMGLKKRFWLVIDVDEVFINGVSLMLKSSCLFILRFKVDWFIRFGSEVFGGRCILSENFV